MIIDWLRSNHWLNFFRKRDVLDTSWFQRKTLKKKYQGKKQDQSYKNQAEINRPPVKTRLAKNANSNIISFEPKKRSIRKIKEA